MPPSAITAAPMKKPIATCAAVAGVDQLAEEQRAGDAADRGADGVEERDRQRPGLHREDLADTVR